MNRIKSLFAFEAISILMFFAMIAWGSTWVSAKILGGYLGSFELIFWRFLFASLGLIPLILFLKHSWKLSFSNLLLALISGVLLVAYNYFFFMGCHLGEAGFGGVLVTTLNPIATFILVALISRKKLTKIEATALIIGAIGTMSILEIWKFGLNIWLEDGVKYFILAAITWPFITILSAKLKDASAIVFSFYMFLSATLIIYLFILNTKVSNIANLDAIFWLNLLLLSLFGTTFGTSVYFIASSTKGSKWASSYFFLVPFSAAIFASIYLNESLNYATIIGGFLTIVAIYILNGYSLNIKRLKCKQS